MSMAVLLKAIASMEMARRVLSLVRVLEKRQFYVAHVLDQFEVDLHRKRAEYFPDR
jgi:hypothetical protein